MSDREQFQQALLDLGRCIEALGAYREDAVLTGGMVPFFYRNLPTAARVEQEPLMTFDADWTVPVPLAKRPGQTLDLNLRDAHFVGILLGEDAPVVFYQHERHGTQKLAPIHVEFLAPRRGAPKDRKGKDRTSVQAQPGLWAQALPYLDLLLQETITMDASMIKGLALPAGRTVLLPHPATYVIQKALCRPKRQPDKRDKDLAYIYDVATLTRTSWPDMAGAVVRLKSRGCFPAKWFTDARRTLARLFGSAAADGPLAVARIYQDAMGAPAAPSEAAIHRVMELFLPAIGMAAR